jgi:hypothetical protein
MLKIGEMYDTIGVQGYARVNCKMECIITIVKRKFATYSTQNLIKEITEKNPNVQYVKIYKKTPFDVPFFQWYSKWGREIEPKVMDAIFEIELNRK